MTVAVSDARSNASDQIAHAANALRSSPRRKKVFIEIYRGKKKAKTVAELMKATKLTQVAVLQEGGKLAGLACTRFRRHRVRCFDGTGGVSWRGGSLHASSSLRLCG
jgi:hypothetical protein